MSNGYSLDLTSRTAGFASVAFVGAILGGVPSGVSADELVKDTANAPYQLEAIDLVEFEPGTFSSGQDYIQNYDAEEAFGKELGNLYSKFASEQTALDNDFQDVLRDNLWDLYIRS